MWMHDVCVQCYPQRMWSALSDLVLHQRDPSRGRIRRQHNPLRHAEHRRHRDAVGHRLGEYTHLTAKWMAVDLPRADAMRQCWPRSRESGPEDWTWRSIWLICVQEESGEDWVRSPAALRLLLRAFIYSVVNMLIDYIDISIDVSTVYIQYIRIYISISTYTVDIDRYRYIDIDRWIYITSTNSRGYIYNLYC